MATRLTVGNDGIVLGAGAIAHDAVTDRAVLLLHGFGDTPQTLHYVADALFAAGYTVRAPLLPGHGRTLAEFGTTRAKQWIGAAREAYAELAATHGPSPVVGLSMGGALGILLAAETPTMPALALVAPYVSIPRRARVVARFHPLWELVTPYFRSGGERSILDPAERAATRGYGVLTPRLLFELSRVVRRVQVSLPRVRVPTLVIHGLHDERIPPDAAGFVPPPGADLKESNSRERSAAPVGRDAPAPRLVGRRPPRAVHLPSATISRQVTQTRCRRSS